VSDPEDARPYFAALRRHSKDYEVVQADQVAGGVVDVDAVAGRIEAHEEDELKNTLESASVLVQSYVPPVPQKLQAAVAAGNMQILTAQPGQAILAFSNYQLPGDSLTLTMNLEPRVMQTIDVSTWMGSPDKPVTLVVQMQQLPDGTNYPQLSTLTIPSSNLQVMVNNSDFQKVGM